jgi:O-antigen/teichoic acid export membrane protein
MADSAAKPALLLNAASNWLGFAVQVIVVFFLSPVLVHGLGDERYGIWQLVESILAYLTLLDLGVAAAVVRFVAKFEETSDQDKVNRVFSTSICIFSLAGALAMLIALGVAILVPHCVQIPDGMLYEARWMLVLLGLNLGLGLPLNVFACVLEGLGRYPVKNAIRTGVLLTRVPMFLGIVWSGGGLVPLAWAITGCNLAEHVLMALVARRCLPGLRFSVKLADRTTLRSIWGYSLNALLAMLAGRVSFQTDAFVLGMFRAVEQITFFSIAARLVEYAKTAVRSLTAVLVPAFSSLEARGDEASIRGVLVESTRYVLWVIVPIEIGLLLLGKPFIALWMGERYAELSYPILVILAIPLVLAIAQSVASRVLYGTGRLRWFARAVMAEALCNLLLSLALVGPLGMEGVALGTSIPSLIFDFAILIYVCRMLDLGVFTYLRRAFVTPCLTGLVLTGAWLAVDAHAMPQTWSKLLAMAGLGTAGFFGCALLIEVGPERIIRRLRMVAGRVHVPEQGVTPDVQT